MMFLAVLLALFTQTSQSQPGACSAADSIETTIARIHRQPDRFLDRCVKVSGLFSGIRLYSSRDGIYLTGRFGRDGNFIPANLRHRIGVDSQPMRNLRLRTPASATVIGRVDSCERRYRRIEEAGGIPFLAGYCHYEAGPTIVVNDYRLQRSRFERLTGEAARRRFGNIAPIPQEWPHRSTLQAFATDFLAALRLGDRARMMELHDIRTNTDSEQDLRMLSMLVHDPQSPFAELRQHGSPQTAIFVSTRDGVLGHDESNAEVSGIICFCRTEDCSDRWPIAYLDADNAPDRPYACTVVVPRHRAPRRAGLRTPVSQSGFLAEPAATALRR